MGEIASQFTSLTIVYSTVFSEADKKNIKSPHHWPLCGEFTGTDEFPAQMATGLDTYFFLNLAVGQPSNDMDLSEIEIYLDIMIIFFLFR